MISTPSGRDVQKMHPYAILFVIVLWRISDVLSLFHE